MSCAGSTLIELDAAVCGESYPAANATQPRKHVVIKILAGLIGFPFQPPGWRSSRLRTLILSTRKNAARQNKSANYLKGMTAWTRPEINPVQISYLHTEFICTSRC